LFSINLQLTELIKLKLFHTGPQENAYEKLCSRTGRYQTPALLEKFGLKQPKQETGVGGRLPGPCPAPCPEQGCWWRTLVTNTLGGTSCPPSSRAPLDPVLPRFAWHRAALRSSTERAASAQPRSAALGQRSSRSATRSSGSVWVGWCAWEGG